MLNPDSIMEGRFLGMPVRFDAAHAFDNFWLRGDTRVFIPTNFGIGWDVNFFAIARHLGLVRG